MAKRLFNAAPTLKIMDINQSRLARRMVSSLSSEALVDIWSVLAVTPEKNVDTVKMFVKFKEDRACSWLIADTPLKQH